MVNEQQRKEKRVEWWPFMKSLATDKFYSRSFHDRHSRWTSAWVDKVRLWKKQQQTNQTFWLRSLLYLFFFYFEKTGSGGSCSHLARQVGLICRQIRVHLSSFNVSPVEATYLLSLLFFCHLSFISFPPSRLLTILFHQSVICNTYSVKITCISIYLLCSSLQPSSFPKVSTYSSPAAV